MFEHPVDPSLDKFVVEIWKNLNQFCTSLNQLDPIHTSLDQFGQVLSNLYKFDLF